MSYMDESASGNIVRFEVGGADLLSFCDCLSLVRNNEGLIAWGDEDFFTLFEEGKTAFYTATEKSFSTAIESLKLKINNLEAVDYVFIVLDIPSEELNKNKLGEIRESFSQCISSHELWFQIYEKDKTAIVAPVSLPNKKYSCDSKDIDTFKTNVTVYLLANKR